MVTMVKPADNVDVTALERIIDELNNTPNASASWPVIVSRNNYFSGTTEYEYEYPSDRFYNLRLRKCPRFWPQTKAARQACLKLIIDKHMAGEIDIHVFHLGIYLAFGGEMNSWQLREVAREKGIGKKRAEYFKTLPKARLRSNDDFISSVWSSLIDRWEGKDEDYWRSPSLSDIRILFSADQFANFTGHHYEADWVEPLSGKYDLKCQTYTKDKDPMAPEEIPEGWVEGRIILGHEGPGNYRHFVDGEAVHAGAAIQVKFGDGWIAGRYEWRFDGKSPIQIHSGNDVFFINENHRVRVRG